MNALLIAEPEAATRGFLSRHLAQDGFAVVEAAAGGEVLAIAEQQHPTSRSSATSFRTAPALSCAGDSARASRAAAGTATSR